MTSRYLMMLALGVGAQAFVVQPSLAQGTSEVTLTRMECGSRLAPTEVNLRYSDTFSFSGLKLQFVYSCYLIKHGDDYMMWDTGQALDAGPPAPKVSDVDLLAQLKVSADQIKFVGISHFHADHIGQANSFSKATLLIDTGDWEVLTSKQPMFGAKPALVSHWISGGGKVETVPQDRDVFGDGTVVMLSTPGHTPGHHSLMVKLSGRTVILSGDMAHFGELRHHRRPELQFRPLADRRLDRSHQEDRSQSQGRYHHPARCARCRQAADLPRVGQVG